MSYRAYECFGRGGEMVSGEMGGEAGAEGAWPAADTFPICTADII